MTNNSNDVDRTIKHLEAELEDTIFRQTTFNPDTSKKSK